MDTMSKLVNLKILIIGTDGVGTDAAKNLILAGPAQVTLVDDNIITTRDMAANCMIRPSHIQQGKKRSEVTLEGLKVLNDYVLVDAVSESKLDDDSFLNEFDAVLICNYLALNKRLSLTDRIRSLDKSRTRPITVVFGDAMGLMASVFCDFGKNWEVTDASDAPLQTYIVIGVVAEEGGSGTIIYLDESAAIKESVGAVKFMDLCGNDVVTNLNGTSHSIKRQSKYSFRIDANTTDGIYEKGGVITEVRVPETHSFDSFRTTMTAPTGPERSLIIADMGEEMICRPPQLHKIYIAILQFWTDIGRLPAVRDQNDVATVKKIIESIEWDEEMKDVEVSDDIIRSVTQCSSCVISPIASIVGGIAAQEILKTTGKFIPIKQFFHLDFYPFFKDSIDVAEKELNQDVDRYTPVRSIFGQKIFNEIQKSRLFLVGAGALGCEYIKNFALTGFCTSQPGKLTVTDMDMIENSNLNRQFLFRKNHINKYKSDIACQAAVAMNKDFRVASTQTKVDPESESFFDDKFWESLDCVVNALDNVDSRLYVDSRCVWYDKPLLESGTLGVKCNTQAIVPHVTETYGDSVDPPEDSIPLCTLKNFPYKIDHCIQWARDAFEGLFCNSSMELQKAIMNFNEFEKSLGSSNTTMQLETLNEMLAIANAATSSQLQACVTLAHQLFYKKHNFVIKQLQHNFPEDAKNNDTGASFWSGTKRYPCALDIDYEDPLIRQFYYSATRLYMEITCTPISDFTEQVVIDIVKGLDAPSFCPQKVYIKVNDDDETPEGGDEDESSIPKKLKELLDLIQKGNLRCQPLKFEKDDDSNGHIDFIHAMANLRAKNYHIKNCARYETKAIAGKIVPAMATATALITGIAAMELLKMINHKNRPIEDFRGSFIDLSISTFLFMEPLPPRLTKSCEFDPLMGCKVIARPEGFTTWKKGIVNGKENTTLQEFIDIINDMYKVNVSGVGHSTKLIYMKLQKAHNDRLNTPLIKLLETISGNNYANTKMFPLEVTCSDVETNDEVCIPVIQYLVDK